MPPASSQGGSGKKGAGVAMPKPSRNSTPVPASTSLPPQEAYDPDYLQTRVMLIPNLKYDDIVDPPSASAAVPDPRSVDSILAKLTTLADLVEKRSTFYDRGMRFLSDERKKYPDAYGEQEDKPRKHKRKKGSDSLAPPEGDTKGRSSPLRDAKRKHSREPSSSLSPVALRSPTAMDVDEKKKEEKEEEEEESSSGDEPPPPRREMPQSQTFGEDPSTFPDPTVYDVRDTYPGMSEEERKEIYSVARYPRSDLADLIAGDPPDKDFSSAKPTSQINYSTFATYIDPYFRPYMEEDLAFLRERGDRVTPFVMPKRDKRHYSEIWAEEDGSMAIDSPRQGREKLPANQPRGTIDNMTDSMGETDGLSMGPLAERLASIMRPEHRAQPSEDKPMTNGITNGDIAINGEVVNGDGHNGEEKTELPPATYMAESSSEAWKKATHPKLDYPQVDERLKQELRYIGFMPEGVEPDYDAHYDDEVAARLRYLQERLKKQILINGARKARIMDIVKDRMAYQEYSTILEDLDSQVQGAYLKRTRTMGKSKKQKRPGGAGGGSHVVGGAAGTARPGIGDLAKTLMERRTRWLTTIGPVVEDPNMGKVPRVADEGSSIFKPEDMAAYMKKEQQLWDDDVDEE